MCLPILLLLCVLTSCSSTDKGAPVIDWAMVTIWLYVSLVLWLALKAGYYQGLAKARKKTISAQESIILHHQNQEAVAAKREAFDRIDNTTRAGR